MSEHAECLYHAWSCSSDNVGADETNPAASGSTARSSNLFCRLRKKPRERKTDNADTEHVWSELCCGPFHEAAAAPSCDTVSLTVRLTVRLTVKLASCFPNNAGLLPVLTEAPWKKMAQVTVVVQLIPNEV